jgi:hypothetical protein
MATVEVRVDRLEEALQQFVTNVGIEFTKLYNSQLRTEAELRAFKDEMRLFREDTQAFKDEMRLFREDTQAFKDEMRLFREDTQAFKDEMRLFREDTQAFKDEARQQNREMNRRWGELANKLGTLVEDLVAPSLPRIVHEVLGQRVVDLSVRRQRHLADGRSREYDAVAVTTEVVCLNSTKSTLRSADVDRFVEEIGSFREFFPEYQHLPLVGILASLAVEESVLNYAERQGFVVLAVGDQVMEVKNRPGFVPKRW